MKTTIAQWVGISGAVFGVLNAVLTISLWFGPLKDLPQRFEIVMLQLAELEQRLDRLSSEQRDRPRSVRLD